MTCHWCQEPILPEEEHVTTRARQSFHRECICRAIAGSAAHQLGDCSCCGGNREDPPGVSLRESAKLALDAWLTIKGKFSPPELSPPELSPPEAEFPPER